MNKKILLSVVALFCLLSVIMSAFAISTSAAEVKYDTPVHKDMWEEPNFDDPSTYAYSFAFVGDTQCLTIGDRLGGCFQLALTGVKGDGIGGRCELGIESTGSRNSYGVV